MYMTIVRVLNAAEHTRKSGAQKLRPQEKQDSFGST